MSDQSWNNSWGSAAQSFLTQIDHESWGICLYNEVPSNKTTQNQPKTPNKPHANLLISGKFCRLPELIGWQVAYCHSYCLTRLES